jgi:phage tail sheath gpL-like
MSVSVLTIGSTKNLDFAPDATRRYETLMAAAQLLEGLAAGQYQGTVDFQYTTAADAAVRASGTLTMATSSGTVGGVINGVTITVTWGTSDTASSAALAAAINASSNALISGVVTATSALGVTTIRAVQPGKTGNAITLAASGTNVTASGTRLTGGVGGNTAAATFTL